MTKQEMVEGTAVGLGLHKSSSGVERPTPPQDSQSILMDIQVGIQRLKVQIERLERTMEVLSSISPAEDAMTTSVVIS